MALQDTSGSTDLKSEIGCQKTIKNAIECTGVGLHSGSKISMTLKPAAPDSGITFRRTDISGGGTVIPARFDRVVDTQLCTAIGNDSETTIGTVEHLMAALAGCEIDNCEIELNGPEVPAMDGSSAPFVFLIECAGIDEQKPPRRAIRVDRPVRVDIGGKYAELTPAPSFSLDFCIDFPNTLIDRQSYTVQMQRGSFKESLARARTFGFLHEVEHLRSLGLARGGSLENAIVISGDNILNEGGLRCDDEFVRHKTLDAVGDLYLAGAPILGHFEGYCSGHQLNNALLVALFADADNYTMIDFPHQPPPQVAVAKLQSKQVEAIPA